MRSSELTIDQTTEDPELLKQLMPVMDIEGAMIDSICIPDKGYCKKWQFSAWGQSNRILHFTGSSDKYGIGIYNYTDRIEEQQFLW